MAKFENYNTGKGSDAHKDYLKKEIKDNLLLRKFKKMDLTELNDQAEIMIDQYEANPSERLRDDFREIIRGRCEK